MGHHLDDLDTSAARFLERLEQLEEASAERLARLAETLAERHGDGSSASSRLLWLLVGAAVGAVATLLLDPKEGQRRQHEVADRLRSAASDTRERAEGHLDHATNLAQGAAAEAVDAVTDEDEPEDAQQLRQRVRSEVLGTIDGTDGIVVLVHPEGRVELRGRMDSARDRVVAGVQEVDGVDQVITEELSVAG